MLSAIKKNETTSKNLINEVHALTIKYAKYLPARAFLEFCITYLAIEDPDVTVDENVFDGIILLREFNVQRSSIKVICILFYDNFMFS